MRLKSIFIAISFTILAFFIIPLFFLYVNTIFLLPTFSYLILKIFGLVSIVIAISIILYCFNIFAWLGKGSPIPTEPPKKLVIKGLYKYSRNPMYLSYLLIILGEFLFFGHLILFIYLLGSAIFAQIFVVYYEEPILKKRFGQSYSQYCKNTSRWI